MQHKKMKFENSDENNARYEHIEKLVIEWINYQNHLPKNYDTEMLKIFIYNSKLSLEKTKRKYENYFVGKLTNSAMFVNRLPNLPEIAEIVKVINIFPIENLSNENARVWFFSLTAPNPAFDMLSALKLFFLNCDLNCFKLAPTITNIAVFDARHFNASLYPKFISNTFKNAIYHLQDAYPIRIRRIHFLYTPNLVESILTALKPILNVKAQNRFVVHKKIENLAKYFKMDRFPADLGGHSSQTCNEIGQTWYLEHLTPKCEFFNDLDRLQASALPTKKSKELELEGSFRQLTID